MDLSGGKRLLGDLKSKLGLGVKHPAQDQDVAYDDAYYEEGYSDYADDFGDGYGDYGEFEAYGRDYVDDYGYDDGYGYPDDGYRDSRRMSSGTRAREVGRSGGYAGSSYDVPRSTRDRGTSNLPRLLSIDEVRDRTRATRTLRSETPSGSFIDERERASRSSSSLPLPRRSDSFDSMPIPMPEPLPEQPAEGHSGRFLSLLDVDPNSPNEDISRIRALTVLKPVRYGEAERITEVLKKDDVAVLDLRSAAKGLDKRILDFSFGAASVLDASVECVADKVFVVCAGGGLTQEERTQLQAQGVI